MGIRVDTARMLTATVCLFFTSNFIAQQTKLHPPAATATCSKPLELKIDFLNGQLAYELSGKIMHGYPLDAIADEMEHCWPDRPLFVVATWDVPLYALNTPGKLQLSKIRYFIKGRNGRLYTEIAYGRGYPAIPVTADIAPFPEDDGTLHPPTKTPHTKGPQ